jgi:hypothetical protein
MNKKKKKELKEIHSAMEWRDMSFRQARHYVRHGWTYQCEMGWKTCEDRGYCNGDC